MHVANIWSSRVGRTCVLAFALGLGPCGLPGCASSARPHGTQPWTATQVPRTNYRPQDGETPPAARADSGTGNGTPLDPADMTSDDWRAQAERDARWLADQQTAGAADADAAAPAQDEPQFTGTEIGRVVSDAPPAAADDAVARSSFDAVIFNPRSGTPIAADRGERPPLSDRDLFAREPVQPPLARDGDALAPITGPSVDDMGLLLIEMRRNLFRDSIDSDQPLRELIAMAMMSYLQPDLELEPEAFRDLTDDERELLAQMQAYFRALGERLDGSLPARDVIVEEILKLKGRLVREPELELPTIALCWKVDGFAVYTQLEKYAFLAFEERPVILYLELGGFQSEQNRNGQWVTEISQLVEIYSDADGVPVWSDEWVKFPDVSKQKRTDFYIARIIAIPDRLAPGAYHLKVRMRDEKSHAEAETSVGFRVVADRKMAVGG